MLLTYGKEICGFVKFYETKEQYYAKPIHLQGTCIKQNSIKIGEFWRRGWTETEIMVSQILTKDGVKINHVNIFNRKTKQIIDVSNGRFKMVDVDKWFDDNKIIKFSLITYDDALKYKALDGSDYNGTTDKKMMGLRQNCNSLFIKFDGEETE